VKNQNERPPRKTDVKPKTSERIQISRDTEKSKTGQLPICRKQRGNVEKKKCLQPFLNATFAPTWAKNEKSLSRTQKKERGLWSLHKFIKKGVG